MSNPQPVEPTEPRKPTIHDADLDGLTIRRPSTPPTGPSPRWSRRLVIFLLLGGLAMGLAAWWVGLLAPPRPVEVTPAARGSRRRGMWWRSGRR